ncbi:hypothetical protein F2P56_030872 [Juglans regia]|uniref:Protein NTM1-like 9 n=2 Tax=Juglans regia TaxID=51240 RepID=A0A2I4GAF0_JUGRE|nr:protein NTM1-like 9 [Juglans regia]KAF5450533.1 hypothetical protein F2P56_030872 [Juglans regia]
MGELPPNLKQWMRFSPSDEKVMDFLRSKITGNDREVDFIYEAQNCGWEPWDLRNLCLFWWYICGIKLDYPEWWLFLPQDRNGKRSKRSTNAGFWKVTGQPKKIMSDSGLIGKKNFLVFYTGTRPGNITHWVMHEYCTTLKELDGTLPGQKPFVLCRLSYKQKKSVTDPKFNFAGTAVSSPTTAFEVQAEATTTPQIFNETISTTTPVDCGDICFWAHAAENQLGEDAATEEDLNLEMISELLQNPVDFEILTPSSTSLLNRSTAAKSFEECFFESEIASALASPEIFPKLNFDCTTSNAMPLGNCNHVSYNAYISKSEV